MSLESIESSFTCEATEDISERLLITLFYVLHCTQWHSNSFVRFYFHFALFSFNWFIKCTDFVVDGKIGFSVHFTDWIFQCLTFSNRQNWTDRKSSSARRNNKRKNHKLSVVQMPMRKREMGFALAKRKIKEKKNILNSIEKHFTHFFYSFLCAFGSISIGFVLACFSNLSAFWVFAQPLILTVRNWMEPTLFFQYFFCVYFICSFFRFEYIYRSALSFFTRYVFVASNAYK